ncbi:MAG: hypothetical protein KGK10_09275 [Rhodospirillales bacterium]|nr:hypothetical protein [Rhodospirillales bacterium]
MPKTYSLTGISGQVYTYTEFSPGADWNDIAGNYAFAKIGTLLTDNASATILYLGQADSFKSRFSNHEAWAPAVQHYNANAVLARVNPNGEAARKAEEKDLIARYNPPLNTQHRTAPPGQPQLPPRPSAR